MLKRSLAITAAAVMAVAVAVPAIAQESGWGGDAENFTFERPARMKPEADNSSSDFSAALEAAAAAEGRAPTTAPASEQGFVPKNEVTVIKNPGKADSAAQKSEKKKKEKKPKAEGDGKTMSNTVGGRMGFGNIICVGLDFGVGTAEAQRVNVGMHLGYFGFGDVRTSASEMLAFYEWRFNISDELSWFIGPGVGVGLYGTSWVEKQSAANGQISKYNRFAYAFSGGVGGRTGLQVRQSASTCARFGTCTT